MTINRPECPVHPSVSGIMGFELNGEQPYVLDRERQPAPGDALNFPYSKKERVDAREYPVQLGSTAREQAQEMRRDTVESKSILLSCIGKILGVVRAIGCILWLPITFAKYVYYAIRYLDNDPNQFTPEAKKAWKLAFTSAVWSPLEGYRNTNAYFARRGSNRNDVPETGHFMSEDKKVVKTAVERRKSAERAEERTKRRAARDAGEIVKGALMCGQCIFQCLASAK